MSTEEILQVILILVVATSMLFGIKSYRASVKTNRLNAYLKLKSFTVASNDIVMRSAVNLEIASKIMYSKPGTKIDPRTRWIAFGLLNAAEASWQAEQITGFDEYASAMLDHHLKRLLCPISDPKDGQPIRPVEVWEALYSGGYGDDFIGYCKNTVSTDFKMWVEQQTDSRG